MADKERKYPVDRGVIHHSAGHAFKNAEALEIQDWFDDCGRGRGYESHRKKFNLNPEDLHSGHKHPRRDKETFSQAHYALHEYKGKWRLVLLMEDPFNNIAWHAGNWEINRRSLGIEVCGTYFDKVLPVEALQVIVDGFIQHAKNLADKGIQFLVTGHRDHDDTECPGKLYDQLPLLNSMFNIALNIEKDI